MKDNTRLLIIESYLLSVVYYIKCITLIEFIFIF